MATLHLLPILAALAAAPPATTVDLSEIQRTIAKEPAYQTKLPKYCLLIFGQEAKTRVWLVLDGHDLYIDRDGNGDLTQPGKCVRAKVNGRWLDLQAGAIQEAGGKTREIGLRVRDLNMANGKCTGLIITLDGKRKQFVGFDETAPFRFAQSPQQAPILYLEGPLAMRLWGEPPTLFAGQEAELNVSIGTPGVGPGSFCAIQCCTVLDCKVSPIAQIEFPRRSPRDLPLQARVPIADD